MQLSQFKVLTFDCYGTLIDWETGMLAALKPLAKRASRALGDDDVLAAHARHESFQQTMTPNMNYSCLLAVVHKRLAEEWGASSNWDEAQAYGGSIPDWPAFADSAAALAALKRRYKLVILSNVDNASFAASNRKLGVTFDAVFTAEDIGSYKPSPRNFEYMLEKLGGYGIQRSEILHTAESLYHDHKPANDFGLASCWIHRRHERGGFGATMNPGAVPHSDFRFISMAAMADAVAKEGA